MYKSILLFALVGFHWRSAKSVVDTRDDFLIRERDGKQVCLVMPHWQFGFEPMCSLDGKGGPDLGTFETREQAKTAAEKWAKEKAK